MTTVIHHTKYKEIDGLYETVEMNFGSHSSYHTTMRHNGKSLKIPRKIIKKAGYRAHREENIKRSCEYIKNNVMRFSFFETIEEGIGLSERFKYNNITGNVMYSSRFDSIHGASKIHIIDEEKIL